MRRCFSLVLALGLLAAPAPSLADVHPPLAADTAGEASFELFGTSFCYAASRPMTGCDAPLPERLSTLVVARRDQPRRVKVLGVMFCAGPSATGPACDVVWVPPTPMQAWRGQPEVWVPDTLSVY